MLMGVCLSHMWGGVGQLLGEHATRMMYWGNDRVAGQLQGCCWPLCLAAYPQLLSGLLAAAPKMVKVVHCAVNLPNRG